MLQTEQEQSSQRALQVLGRKLVVQELQGLSQKSQEVQKVSFQTNPVVPTAWPRIEGQK